MRDPGAVLGRPPRPPPGGPYVLRGARVPASLLAGVAAPTVPGGLCEVDIGVAGGRIAEIRAPRGEVETGRPALGLDGALVLPCPVDLHTHLDKGHIWPRAPNPDGTFTGALASTGRDREAAWHAADVRARMDFSLRSAYAHGTRAVRTHIDSIAPQDAISWPVFAELREAWSGRIELQGVSLVGIEAARDGAALDALADRVAAHDGILGAVTYMTDDIEALLDRLFAAAETRGLDLDFHADETGEPAACSLRLIAETALKRRFRGAIVAGHCCSLSMQREEEAETTLRRVAEAGIGVVSLPMCNLYLQDRAPGRTPRWRGVTLVHEMRAHGIAVAFGSDNTRDPFYAYGDLDMIEVFREAVRIAHLDHPIDGWVDAVTAVPVALMGLGAPARLAVGGPADLVVLRGRSWTEVLSRPESERLVLRGGRAIEADPPAYAELDAPLDG